MVLHNPNNWHWVNKDASAWAKSYFDENLTKISAEENGVTAQIDSVLDVDGDVDVSQRKGKVITLFDVKIRLEFKGKTAEGKDASGTITIPEVAHDTAEDEYVFEISLYTDADWKEPVKNLVRSKIVPQLRTALDKFSGDLIAEHGKDIQHGPDNNPGKSPAPIPSTKASPSQSTSSTTTTAITPADGPLVNTTTLSDIAEFQTTAAELYTTFVDPARITAFTRAPPNVFEPKVGGKFKIFGGNVEGEFVELEQDRKIVMKWRLSAWATGHFSTLTLLFDQGYNATTLRYTWDGVPIGQEDVTKKNFNEYYIKSIKTTFGYAPHPSSFLGVSTAMFWFFSAVLVPVIGFILAYMYLFGDNSNLNIPFMGDW